MFHHDLVCFLSAPLNFGAVNNMARNIKNTQRNEAASTVLKNLNRINTSPVVKSLKNSESL